MDVLKLIGMTENAAIAEIQSAGMLACIVGKDGKHFIITCDYCLDRVNLTLVAGLVVQAEVY